MTWGVVRIADADGGERFLCLCLYMYWCMYMTYQWNDAPGTLLVCFPFPVPRKNVDATFSRCVGSGHLWKIDIPCVPENGSKSE